MCPAIAGTGGSCRARRDRPPSAMPRFLLVGPGRVGCAFVRLADRAGHTCIAIAGREAREAGAAARSLGLPDVPAVATTTLSPELLGAADLVCVATQDAEIAIAAKQLAARGATAAEGAVVFHCSGHVASERLAPLRACGFALGSVHPLRSFGDSEHAATMFANTPCGLEGDEHAVERLWEFAEAIGGRPFTIPSDGKALYHAGAVMACNYLVTLVQTAVDLYERIGLAPDEAVNLLVRLVEGTVSSVQTVGLPGALTGPIDRGDTATVREHLDALAAQAPEFGELYRVLGRHTIDVARRKGSLSDAGAADLLKLLNADSE